MVKCKKSNEHEHHQRRNGVKYADRATWHRDYIHTIIIVEEKHSSLWCRRVLSQGWSVGGDAMLEILGPLGIIPIKYIWCKYIFDFKHNSFYSSCHLIGSREWHDFGFHILGKILFCLLYSNATIVGFCWMQQGISFHILMCLCHHGISSKSNYIFPSDKSSVDFNGAM